MRHLYSRLIYFCLLFSTCGVIYAQPAYDLTKLKMEKLGRGFVAIRENDSTVNLSWRFLSSDPAELSFNV